MDYRKEKDRIVEWIREWFALNGPDSPAVIGISGGKDSSVMAALCVEALGKERVIGVTLPQNVQPDIDDSYKLISSLGIRSYEVNIGPVADMLKEMIEECEPYPGITFTSQAAQNMPPRLRMTTLYAVSQSLNGRVACTCNLSERMIGWETVWGDAVGDFAPFANLTATEVIEIGKLTGIPAELIVKTPSDGLCGKTDEDKFGFTYAELDSFIRKNEQWKNHEKILSMAIKSAFKRNVKFPSYIPKEPNYLELAVIQA